MSKNGLIILVSLMAAVLGSTYLIIAKEPNVKKYAVDAQDYSYPKLNPASGDKSKPDIVAKIGDLEINEETLIGADGLMLYEIQQQEFEFKMGRLRRLVTEHFVETKAKELKISPEDFIRNHIVKGKNLTPSESEMINFAKDQGLPDFNQIKSNQAAYDQIAQFIRMKKEYDLVQVEVNKWTKKNKVSYFFDRPSLPMKIPEYSSPAWGPVKAKVVIFKFSDFECPFCSRAGKTLLKIKQKYQDSVRIVYKHFPLENHLNAKSAAIASVCIHEQKPMGFWEFYESMLDKHDKISPELLRAEAKKLKINMAKFDECLTAPASEATVLQDMELANRMGLESTPVFFINGEIIKGSAPMEAFEEIINYHLNKKD